MVQEPARASEAGDVLPREPVTRGLTPAHVLTRPHVDVVHDAQVVTLGDVARGLSEDFAVVHRPPQTRVHIHPGGRSRHARVTHLQRVAVPQEVAERRGHSVLKESLEFESCVSSYLGIPCPPVTFTLPQTLILTSSNTQVLLCVKYVVIIEITLEVEFDFVTSNCLCSCSCS